MRLEIDGGGYASASTAFETANHRAAMTCDALGRGLSRQAAVAGSDSTSAEFAAAYDDAAYQSVELLGDLISSFASLGRLTGASLVHHREAERASVLGGSEVYDGSVPDGGYLTVASTRPPSCLGGDSSSLPAELTWILDQVQGFVWPDADTDRLREVASTWRRAAAEVGELTVYCDGAVRCFSAERSPEVTLAVGATRDLRVGVAGVSTQLNAMAAACEEYADQVEGQRQDTVDLVRSLLEEAVVIQGIGIVLGAVTAGLTAAGAAAINAARIAAAAPRFLRIVTVLRELTAATTRGVRLTLDALARVRTRLRKFVEARVPVGGRLLGTSSAKMAGLRVAIRDPRVFDPQALRGMSPAQLRRLLDDWPARPSRQGGGVRYRDPEHQGRQVRVMPGYAGNRPDELTHGPYAVVTQNGDTIKIPLEGNLLL